MKISIDYVTKLKQPLFQYHGVSSRSIGKRFAIFRPLWQFENPVFKPNSVSTTSPLILINSANVNSRPKRYVQALDDFFQGIQQVSTRNMQKFSSFSRQSFKVPDRTFSIKIFRHLPIKRCKHEIINKIIIIIIRLLYIKWRSLFICTLFILEYSKNMSNYNLNCQEGKANYFEKPCFFDIKKLGSCSKSPYGYTEPMQPCVLIKFNKRFDWIPECYNRSSNLPETMPDGLKKMVRESDKLHIWLSCDGLNNVDKEHMGEIEYNPRPGFPVEFFPFTGQPDYLSPVVALQFKNLTPNRLVTIDCNLWASNIRRQSGCSLDFQIIIGKMNFCNSIIQFLT
ncbi:sodium/potassium-transporting ATPase subunit beta-1-like isoform X2 [Osmia bicornis bicornis]|uniref:sodium/potassium-transporting ATPase subunit beta-1-like isoform X2 n=1 Tax=Osmia bicornis bicornis TaxID=1437191 RepID=UPI001EAEF407|nr:sodium/potassium-transporting ATPase subunit beta-1-like isoform X2 [Osmia bicornis bicornis]